MNEIEKQKIINYLSKSDIDYQIIEHDAAATMEDCQRVNLMAGATLCKNLFLQNRQGTDFYLLLMDGEKRFRTAEVSKKINTARLSFGSPEKLQELLHEYGGAINPFGLVYDTANKVQVIIDRDLLDWKEICFHPMVNTASVKMKVCDFISKILPDTNHTPIIIDITGEIDKN